MKYGVGIAMFGWIPFALGLFAFLPPRRAAVAGFLIAWMFLPIATYPIPGLPDYTKMSATCLGVLLAIALFDFRRLIALRPGWVDIPILVFCLSPFVSSIMNGLGAHDGLSAVFAQLVTWGVPYVIGRLYFDDLPGLRELATGIFLGGLLYVPLCLFELWRGPELHRLVYGYYQPDLDVKMRFGILRPMVFMESGLMVAVWIAAAGVLGIWLWKARALPSAGSISLAWLVPVLFVMTILMRSVNGWILLALGAGILLVVAKWHSAAPVVCLMVLILIHIAMRSSGVWSGTQAVQAAAGVINKSKGNSILFRFINEDIIAANVRQRPIFGWGRQGSVLYDKATDTYAVCDSLWIVIYAEFGVVGLIGLIASLLLPVVSFIRRFPASRWEEASIGPAAALAVVLVLYMTDHLANAMINPVFMLAAGGLAGLSAIPAPKIVSTSA